MSSNQVPDIEQPSTSSGRVQAGTTKRSKRKSSDKDAGNHSKKQKIEERTEGDKEQSTLDEAADETTRDNNETTEDVEIEFLAEVIVAEVPGNQAQTGHLQADFNGGQEDNQANRRDLTPEEIEKIKHPMGRNAMWQTRSIKPRIGNQKRTEERNKKLKIEYAKIRNFIDISAKEIGKSAEEKAKAIITGEVQQAWAWKQEEFFEQAEEHALERIAEVEIKTEGIIDDMTTQNNREKEDLQKENEALHKRLKDTEAKAERSVEELAEKVENMQAKETELKEKLESLEKENTEIKAELARAELARDELYDTKNELVETTRAKMEAEAQNAAKNEEMYSLEKYLNGQIGLAAQKALEDEETINDQGKKIEKLENEKEKEVEEKQALEAKVEELKEEVKNKTKDKETLEGDLAGTEKRLQDEETRTKKLKHDLTTAQKEIEVSRQTVVKQKKTIKDHKDEITQIKKNRMSANLLKEMLKDKTKECENLRKSKQKLEERMTAQLIIEDEEDEQTEETEEETEEKETEEETEEVEEPDDSEQEEPGYDESAGEATDETDDEQEN